MEQFLKSLLISLNSIEVKGRENMDYLLGAIIAIESMLNQIEAQKVPTVNTETEDEDG